MSSSLAVFRRACLVVGLLMTVGGSAWAQCPAPFVRFVHDFGSVTVGTTSAPQTENVQCSVGGTCVGFSATIVGPNAAEFMVTGNTCNVPTFTGQCTVTMTFTPAACGPRVAFLLLARTGPDGACPAGSVFIIVPLTGTGTATPVVGPALTFPSTLAGCPGGCSGCITLTIPANVTPSVFGPNFTLIDTTCPVTTGTCTVTVCFTPEAAGCGTLGGTLVLTSTLTGCPLATFSLSGFACSFTCAIGLAGSASLSAAGRQCILESLQIAANSTGLTRCAALRCAECCAKTEAASTIMARRTAALLVLDQIHCLQAFFGCTPFPC